MSSVTKSIVAKFARILAELMLTAGALLAAFVFYLVFWTGVQTAQAQQDHLEEFRTQQKQHPEGRKAQKAPTGTSVNVLHIPRLGQDWEWVVVEGVDLDTLNDGPGHFPGTALPGEVGNFAVAGHRATHGEPFAHLDLLTEGDEVFVEAPDGWYTYRVTWSRIVAPTQTDVLAPVPGHPGKSPTAHTMTLVTCHPRWSSTERLIVGAELIEQRTLTAGPPAELEG